MITLLTVYSSSKGFLVNLLWSENNMFSFLTSQVASWSLGSSLTNKEKKWIRYTYFFVLNRMELLHGGGRCCIETVSSNLNHSKVHRHAYMPTWLCKRHHKNTLPYITRHNFGQKKGTCKHCQLLSNNIKVSLHKLPEWSKRRLWKTYSWAPILGSFLGQGNSCYSSPVWLLWGMGSLRT